MRRDLLTSDEVMRLPDHTMLVLRPGRDPLIAGKVRHYADPEFRDALSRRTTPTGAEPLPALNDRASYRP